MTYKVDCGYCQDGEIVIEISGRFYAATLEEPAEFPEVELVSRTCNATGTEENEFDDACAASDDDVADRAAESVMSGPD